MGTSFNISADCTLLALGSHTGTVAFHSLPDGNATRCLHAHRGEVWAVQFSPDRSLLATTSRDEPDSVKLWSTSSLDLVQALRGHVGIVLDCAFSSDGLQMVTCGFDRTLRVWRRRGGSIRSSSCSSSSSSSCQYSSIAGASTSPACSWRCENVLVGHGDVVMSCAFAHGVAEVGGGILVASGARDGLVRAWRLADVPQLTAAEAAAQGVPFL